jgi:hypothetical protein
MANAQSARAGRARTAGATRPALTALPCRARRPLTMVKAARVCECHSPPIQRARQHGRCCGSHWHRTPRSLVIIATLLFVAAGAAAHPPEAEFADWFRSLKEPGTDGAMGGSVSCCSPARDCQTTDYETDSDGRYWVIVEGERIQVPPDKILQRTDNPTGRGVACLGYYDGHPIVRCFVRAPEG